MDSAQDLPPETDDDASERLEPEPDDDAEDTDEEVLEPEEEEAEALPRITQPGHASRLAWSMVEILSTYHGERAEAAVRTQTFQQELEDEILDLRQQFEERVDPTLHPERLFDNALETWCRALRVRAGLEPAEAGS